MTPTLWHFCCSHARQKLGGKSYLRPGADFLGPTVQTMDPLARYISSLVWLTDQPDGAGAGLERVELNCDRLEHRYRALRPVSARRWDSQFTTPARFREAVYEEIHLGADWRPGTWWVSNEPVLVVYDPTPGMGSYPRSEGLD